MEASIALSHVGTCVRDLQRRCADYGATEMRPVTRGNAQSLYFRESRGNRIELFCDTPWYVDQPTDQPMVIPMDMSLPDDTLWAWIEETARRLPGFKPVEERREEIARRRALGTVPASRRIHFSGTSANV